MVLVPPSISMGRSFPLPDERTIKWDTDDAGSTHTHATGTWKTSTFDADFVHFSPACQSVRAVEPQQVDDVAGQILVPWELDEVN